MGQWQILAAGDVRHSNNEVIKSCFSLRWRFEYLVTGPGYHILNTVGIVDEVHV
jgi:hypothetical protein